MLLSVNFFYIWCYLLSVNFFTCIPVIWVAWLLAVSLPFTVKVFVFSGTLQEVFVHSVYFCYTLRILVYGLPFSLFLGAPCWLEMLQVVWLCNTHMELALQWRYSRAVKLCVGRAAGTWRQLTTKFIGDQCTQLLLLVNLFPFPFGRFSP